MRALLLVLLVPLPALAQDWMVWPDSAPGVVAEVRETAGALVSLSPEEAATTTFEQARQLGATCGFGDEACLRRLMQLGAITQLLWIDRVGEKLQGVAVFPDGVRTVDGERAELRSVVTRLIAPDRFVGTVRFVVSPEGAAVSMGGELVAGESMELPPGPYEFDVAAEGHAPAKETIEVVFGAEALLEVRLEAIKVAIPPPDAGPTEVVDAGPDPIPDPVVPPAEGLSALGISGLALFGVGVVATAATLGYAQWAFTTIPPRDQFANDQIHTQGALNAAIATGSMTLLGALFFGADLIF